MGGGGVPKEVALTSLLSPPETGAIKILGGGFEVFTSLEPLAMVVLDAPRPKTSNIT